MLRERIVRKAKQRWHATEPEVLHDVVLRALSWLGRHEWLTGECTELLRVCDTTFMQRLMGLTFMNPIGLAAGFDKNAVAVHGLAALGFGFLEVGTVTRFPNTGNEGMRILRVPDERALLNRMGFPSDGAEAVAERLQRRRSCHVPLGISIGKPETVPNERALAEIQATFRILAPRANYMAINLSSPNTPSLRTFLAPEWLPVLLNMLRRTADSLVAGRDVQPVPIVVKLPHSLDLHELDAILDCCIQAGVQGVIVANSLSVASSAEWELPHAKSGSPLLPQTLRLVRHAARRTEGRLVIIGSGGVLEPQDALRMIEAGAHLVQIYTGLVYGGPLAPRKISKGLLELCTDRGIRDLAMARRGVPALSHSSAEA